MGLFSEMLDESRILNSMTKSQNILMITCPGCACESLSYTEDLPNRSLEQGKDMEHSAIAVHTIRDRYDKKLKELGKKIQHISIAFPCEMTDADREIIYKSIQGNDTVAVLACSSGYVGIADMLKNHFNGILSPMMKTSGTFVFRLVTDESGKNSKVDKSTARIIKFKSP